MPSHGKGAPVVSVATSPLVSLERKFPMFTVPLQVLLRMTQIQKHEELMEEDALRRFDESMGRAMFVSHQWLAMEHPDPNFQQLSVLQQALTNLCSGTSRVSLPPVVEVWFGRMPLPTVADFKKHELYIWYDYFCIPQSNAEVRHCAISSIPSYIAMCYFFVILSPPSKHKEGHTLSPDSWAERGWCRLENMARRFGREDGFVISVQVAGNPTLAQDIGGVALAPGKGLFSVDEDRDRFRPVLQQMLWSKLHSLLFKGDFHNYRFLLNLQEHAYGGLGIQPLEGLIPNFETEIDPSADPHGFVVARYLHDTGFKTVRDRDEAGWSPMCYAVLRDDPFLIKALLLNRADVNDAIAQSKKDAHLIKEMSVLAIAAFYNNCKAMKELLFAKAQVNAANSLGGNALHPATAANSIEAVRMLHEANIDPTLKAFPGIGAFKMACAFAGVQMIKEMMIRFPGIVNLQFCLHTGLAFSGGLRTVSFLLEASADINEQFVAKKRNWWVILKVLSFRHWISPSALTYMASNCRGATPLMFSIMTGKFDCTSLLLSAGARLNLRNAHGKTALDIARETGAPVSIESLVMGTQSMAADGDDSADSDFTIEI
eukprot:Skav215787  [mRNA]  locus=scaffold3885:11859:13658:+ [translate_table: standard]